MQICTAPSFLLLALVLAITQSATAHPIRTSKWVKTGEFEDPSARGIWKVFEKEGFDQLPDPPHVTYNQKPAWQTNRNNEPTEQEIHSNRYVKGVSESGKPTVSVLIPKTMSKQMHNHNQHTEEEKDHHSSESKERAIHAIEALAAQRQDRYSEILKYLYIDHAQNNKHKTSAPVSSFSVASDNSVSFFSYQSSFPTMRSKTVTSHHYRLPGVFPTIMVLVAMVWIALFVIGLIGFGNYLWELWWKALRGQENEDRRSEEGDTGLEKMKIPLRFVNAPSKWTRSQSTREHGYEFLGTVASDAESDSGSESEEDYQIF